MATASESSSDIMMETARCPEIAAAKQQFNAGPTVKAFVNDNYATVAAAFRALNLSKSQSSYSTLCGWAIAFNCSDNAQAPVWLTDDVMAVCQRAQALWQYDTYANATSRGLYSSYIMRHILWDADVHIGASSEKKFAFFSAHDTTVAPILVALGFTDVHVPLYASHIAIEYWRDSSGEILVRFLFNGEPIRLDLFAGRTVVRFDEFRRMMEPLWNHCTNIGNWETWWL
jgi:acid phosphatase